MNTRHQQLVPIKAPLPCAAEWTALGVFAILFALFAINIYVFNLAMAASLDGEKNLLVQMALTWGDEQNALSLISLIGATCGLSALALLPGMAIIALFTLRFMRREHAAGQATARNPIPRPSGGDHIDA